MVKIDTAEPEISPSFTPLILLPFQNMVPKLPTMQFGNWVTSLESIDQITCSFLWRHKKLDTTYFAHAVVLQDL